MLRCGYFAQPGNPRCLPLAFAIFALFDMTRHFFCSSTRYQIIAFL